MTKTKIGSYWKADLARYPKHSLLLQPALWAIAVYRFGNWTMAFRGAASWPVRLMYYALYSTVRLATGIDIPRTVRVGPGLMIHHFGGININPMAVLGAHCTLRQGVTIGTRTSHHDVPVIGDRVEFGAYSQVLGDVSIGDGAVIGALTLVISDVPAGSTVAGVPSRVIRGRANE